jgi:hypothetical protein
MSGVKTATISSSGGAAALTGGAIVIGAAVVIGTAMAARAAELKYHVNAVKRCHRKINDVCRCEAVVTWITSNEKAILENYRQKLNGIAVSEDLAQARLTLSINLAPIN